MIFADPLLVALILAVTAILIIGNLYFIAHYSHHADNAVGGSTACKFIILVSFILAECQILLLPLDVLNSRDNTNIDMFVLW